MNSSLLCVIGIRLMYPVSARDPLTGVWEMKAKAYLECADLFELSSDILLSVKRGDWPEDNDDLKDWVHCVLVRNDVMTEQGEVRIDVALKDFSEFEAAKKKARIDKCLPLYNYNMPPPELSWQFAKCYQREDPKNSLF